MENKVINNFFLFLLFSFIVAIIFSYKSKADVSPPSTLNIGTLHKDGEINWDGKSRIYYYYEPSDPGPPPRPLVILLHGGGGNVESFLGEDGKKAPFKIWLDIADEEKLYLAIPQGYENYWNDCRGDCANGDEDDLGFLNEMIDRLTNKFNIDPERIYATGESNGGHMSYRLAMELSDRIAAIGVVIAGFPAQNQCSGPVNPISVLIMNGTDDPICPWEGGEYNIFKDRGTVLSAEESVNFWIRHNGCDTIPQYKDFPDLATEDNSTVRLEKYLNGTEGTEVYFYRIDGGGHNPPSIIQQYLKAILLILGKQNYDIEMAREVWDFLKRHTLTGMNTAINTMDSDDLSDVAFQLSQNYPNPFNHGTTIEYRLTKRNHVSLKIFDVRGREILTLVQGEQPQGHYQIQLDSHSLPTGTYYYQLKTEDQILCKRMLLLK